MNIVKNFLEFIKKQNIISVALGLAAGLAATALINAMVNDLVTPIYSPYMALLNPNVTVTIGLSTFGVGHFFQSFVSFVVVLFVIFVIGSALGSEPKK
jgi:large conductance mechanosensitive channel